MSETVSDKDVAAAVSDDDLRAIVRQWWTAMETGDMATVAGLITDDMTFEVMHVGHLMPHNGVYQGREVVERDLLDHIPTAFYIPGQTTFEITAMYVDNPVVVTEFTINATTATGRPYEDVRYVSIMTFEGDKIRYAREYPDALKAKAAHLD